MELSTETNGAAATLDLPQLLASVEGQAAMLSDEECVFHRHDNGEAHVMTLEVLQAMGACKAFNTRDHQIESIAKALPHLAENRSAIDSMLKTLQQRGLVESVNELVGRAVRQQGISSDESHDADADLYLMLGDEVPNAESLLQSVSARLGDNRLPYRVFAVETCDDEDVASAHRDCIARCEADGHSVRYLDRAWQHRLHAHLSQVSGKTESGRVTGSTVNQLNPHNVVNLITAGRKYLMLDDRHDISTKTLPHARPDRINLRSPNIFPAEFVPEDAMFDSGLTDSQDDPLDLQNQLLGKSVASLVSGDAARQMERTALAGMSWLQLHETVTDATVLTTQPGSWGDSRIDSSLWFYSMPWQMTSAMRIDEKKYRALLHRPRLTEFYPSLQLANQSKYLPTGVDNRLLTPPMPDSPGDHARLWYAWMRFTRPNGKVLHLPMMHEYRQPRQGESPYAEEYVPSFNRFMAEYVGSQHAQFRADYPEHRIESLATLYRDLSAASDHDCITLMREYLAYLRAGIISQLQQQLLSAEQVPQFWYDDVTEWITVHGNALQRSDLPVFRGWQAGLTEADIADRMREELDRAADMLEFWTPMWHSCMDQFDTLLSL